MLAAGDITLRHATALVDATSALTDLQVAKVQKRVLERAGNETVAGLRRSVRRAVLAVDPEGAERRHEAKKADRDVRLVPEDDAMATLYASLSADAAARVMTRIEAIASVKVPGDTRTMAQRRADALVQLITHDCEALGPLLAKEPTWHGRKPSVQVSVALSTLLGFDEEPGELAGHGPIFAGLARRIAADLSGTWRRLVTDRVGRLLDYGRSTYRPPQDLTDFVIARDQTSRFPYSDVPAERCDIDHQRDWTHGGHTEPANLESLTSRQHHLKHETDWVVTGDPAGPADLDLAHRARLHLRSHRLSHRPHPRPGTRSTRGRPRPTALLIRPAAPPAAAARQKMKLLLCAVSGVARCGLQ